MQTMTWTKLWTEHQAELPLHPGLGLISLNKSKRKVRLENVGSMENQDEIYIYIYVLLKAVER